MSACEYEYECDSLLRVVGIELYTHIECTRIVFTFATNSSPLVPCRYPAMLLLLLLLSFHCSMRHFAMRVPNTHTFTRTLHLMFVHTHTHTQTTTAGSPSNEKHRQSMFDSDIPTLMTRAKVTGERWKLGFILLAHSPALSLTLTAPLTLTPTGTLTGALTGTLTGMLIGGH